MFACMAVYSMAGGPAGVPDIMRLRRPVRRPVKPWVRLSPPSMGLLLPRCGDPGALDDAGACFLSPLVGLLGTPSAMAAGCCRCQARAPAVAEMAAAAGPADHCKDVYEVGR